MQDIQVKQLIQQAVKALNSPTDDEDKKGGAFSDTAILDAQLLLAEILGKDRTWLYTWDDASVNREDQASFHALLARRIAGEPMAHILGYRDFWCLTLACNQSTLIPRPETEHLIETVLALSLPEKARVLDLGTGTGAIALALAVENRAWQIDGLDFSEDAIALAKQNSRLNDLGQVCFFQSDWFQALDSALGREARFDLIVTNPPYVDPESPCLDQGDVRFEPKSALVAGNKGMADIEFIISEAIAHLKPEGWLVLEHGFDQMSLVQDCFRQHGYRHIDTTYDLAGLPRVSYAQCSIKPSL